MKKKQISYFSMIVSEIPNFIQILTLPTLIIYLMDNYLARSITSFIVGVIVGLYTRNVEEDNGFYKLTIRPFVAMVVVMLFFSLIMEGIKQ